MSNTSMTNVAKLIIVLYSSQINEDIISVCLYFLICLQHIAQKLLFEVLRESNCGGAKFVGDQSLVMNYIFDHERCKVAALVYLG